MINKRGGVFAWGMILGVIIFIGLAWHSFMVTNKNIHTDTLNITSFSFKNIHDKFSFYAKESARLAASQAFYEIAKEAAVGKNPSCTIFKENFIWSQNCKPEQESMEKRFLEEYNRSFYSSLKKYPDENIADIDYTYVLEQEKGKILLIASVKTLQAQKKATFATHNISYSFDPSLKLNLTKEEIHLGDFEIIYEATSSAVDECKGSKNVVSCVKSRLRFNRWTTDVKKEGSYLIFKCKTKRYFFFEDEGEKFGPIPLNFVISVE